MSNVTFPKCGVFRQGYDPEAVDRFFEDAREIYESDDFTEQLTVERVRSVTFPMKRGGYAPDAVDQALDRLEEACSQRLRADYVAEHGSQGWLSQTYEKAATLYPRLRLPDGERFAQPEKGRGYDRGEVDAFMKRLTAYFDGKGKLTAADLRATAFTEVKAAKAYDIAVVDVYLDRAVSVLQAVE